MGSELEGVGEESLIQSAFAFEVGIEVIVRLAHNHFPGGDEIAHAAVGRHADQCVPARHHPEAHDETVGISREVGTAFAQEVIAGVTARGAYVEREASRVHAGDGSGVLRVEEAYAVQGDARLSHGGIASSVAGAQLADAIHGGRQVGLVLRHALQAEEEGAQRDV